MSKKIMKRRYETVMTYKEMLQSYSAVDLKNIAKVWGLKGLSKLKKDQIVVLVHDHILDNIEERFSLFNLDHFNIINELFSGKNVIGNYKEAGLELVNSGLVLEGNFSDSLKVVMPVSIFERATQFYDRNSDLIFFNTIFKDFLDLAVTIYGVVTVDEFTDIFYKFNEGGFTKEQISNCITYNSLRSSYSVVEDGYIHYYRLNDYARVYKDIQTRNDLEYKEITHLMLQKFLTNGQRIWSKVHDDLLEVLEKEFDGNIEYTHDLIDELRITTSINHTISEFIQLFSKRQSTSDMIKLKKFADVIISLNSQLPKWELKGNTNLELNGFKIQETIIKEPKVGRNDPCPCGSNKKYKKCCINK